MSRVIVTGGTKEDVAPIGVFAINVANTNAHLFDKLIVFHDGISKKDQRIINAIFPTKFIRYTYPNKCKNDVVLTYFSSMVFCKYECFSLLSRYDEVVWSDYDVVIMKSLDEFCKVRPGHMNCLRSDTSVREMLYSNIENKEIFRYDIDTMGICTPLFAFTNTLAMHEEICPWCYKMTSEWDVDLYLPEQCVFSFAVLEYNIPITYFSFHEYASFPTDAKGDEYILHAAGPVKFWNGLENEEWNRGYSEWKRLGGSPYREWKKKLIRKMKLVKSRMRGIRNKVELR